MLTISVVAIVSTLSGCGDQRISKLSAELATKSRGSAAKVQQLYKSLNDLNRKLYIEELKTEPEANLPDIGEDKASRTGLTDEYPADFVKIRVVTASLIETHCQQLDALANGKNPAETKQAVEALNGKVDELGKELQSTNIGALDTFGSKIRQFWNPASFVINLAANTGLDIYRSKVVKEQIARDSTGFVSTCTALQNALTDSVRNSQLRAKHLVTLQKRRYEIRMKDHPPQALQNELLADLEKAGKLSSEINGDEPAETFGKLAEVYKSLANAASPAEKGKSK